MGCVSLVQKQLSYILAPNRLAQWQSRCSVSIERMDFYLLNTCIQYIDLPCVLNTTALFQKAVIIPCSPHFQSHLSTAQT